MYNIKFNSYIPKPDPAKSDRIVAAHYYGAWKKGAAGVHEGFDDLAEIYPDRTPLMGYYDEENPEVCDWEIKWAVEHGINCFIHCWYRKAENEGNPVTVSNLRCGHALHEAFFNAKFQNHINFAIMFEPTNPWGGTNETDMLENLMPFWMETYFKRENYLIIDNKPVLFMYNQRRLSADCFESIESQRKTLDACREYAKKCGFDGLIIGIAVPNDDREICEKFKEYGYDFRFWYTAGYKAPCDFYDDAEKIAEGQCEEQKKNLDEENMAFVPTATCFWDPTPRFTKRWVDKGYKFRDYGAIWYLPPENFKDMLKKMKKITESLPDGSWGKKMIMIDNWNEWDEGHFVSPSHKFGFKYLQAIREALTECNNLPDYITPQDQGFGGYNKSWKTPDFSGFCEKELKKEM